MNECTSKRSYLLRFESIENEQKEIICSTFHLSPGLANSVLYDQIENLISNPKALQAKGLSNSKVWINDVVISFYVQAIRKDFSKQSNGNTIGNGRKNCIFLLRFFQKFNSINCNNFDLENEVSIYNKKFISSNINGMKNCKSLSNHDLLIFLHCNHLHWDVSVVNKDQKIIEENCTLFHTDKKQMEIIKTFLCIASPKYFDNGTWPFNHGRDNQFATQVYTFSCSIHCILFLFHIIHGIKLRTFHSDELSLIRRHISLSLVTINISQNNTTDVYLTFKLLFKKLPPGIAGFLDNNLFNFDPFLQHNIEKK